MLPISGLDRLEPLQSCRRRTGRVSDGDPIHSLWQFDAQGLPEGGVIWTKFEGKQLLPRTDAADLKPPGVQDDSLALLGALEVPGRRTHQLPLFEIHLDIQLQVGHPSLRGARIAMGILGPTRLP